MAVQSATSNLVIGIVLVAVSGMALVALPWNGEISPTSLASVVKTLVPAILLVLSMASWRFPVARFILAVNLLFLASFNAGQHIHGRLDCGCYPFQVPPLITAGLELLFGFALVLARPPQLCADAWRFTWGMGVLVLMSAAAILGSRGLIPDISGTTAWTKFPDVVYQEPIRVGDTLLVPDRVPRTIILYRPDCNRCERLMPILRARAEQGDAQLVPIIELDVSSGIMRTVDSGVLGRPMPYTHLIARCRLLPTPQIITVFNNRVTFVEDWSQRE